MGLKGHEEAVQRVLHIPEIVSYICEWLAVDDPSTLSKAMRINHLWFHEGLRHLWLEWPAKKGKPLQLIKSLSNMSDNHQELYVRYMKHANLIDAHRATYRHTNYVLLGLVFSKLEYLDIFLEHRRQRFFLPRINAPALKVVRIRVAVYHRPLGQDDVHSVYTTFPAWSHYPKLHKSAANTLCKHIKLRMNHIQKLVFGPEVKVDKVLLEKFKERLPHVEISEQSLGGPSFESLKK